MSSIGLIKTLDPYSSTSFTECVFSRSTQESGLSYKTDKKEENLQTIKPIYPFKALFGVFMVLFLFFTFFLFCFSSFYILRKRILQRAREICLLIFYLNHGWFVIHFL